MIIGITGGIGSGKSFAAGMLAGEYGFRLLSTDAIAKELYLPGTSVYEALIHAFGESELCDEANVSALAAAPSGETAGDSPGTVQPDISADATGAAASRVPPDIENDSGAYPPISPQKLTALVYSGRENERLVNQIVHPAVWRYVRDAVRDSETGLAQPAASAQPPETDAAVRVVIETALPGTDLPVICDEVWYIYADRELRLERLSDGRGMDRAKACGIMSMQPSDSEYRSIADVVIDNDSGPEALEERIAELMKERGLCTASMA